MTTRTVPTLATAPPATQPAALADLYRPVLPALAEEIIAELHRVVPEYVLRLRRRFKGHLEFVVQEELRRFVEHVPDSREPDPRVVRGCRALGRDEFLEGNALDDLQAAYRVSARVIWRRLAAVGQSAHVPAGQLCALAEALITHIEDLSAHSVEAYSELHAQIAEPMARRRRRLLELLIADPAIGISGGLTELAQEAQWRLPRTVAVVVLAEPWYDSHVVSPALSDDVLMDLRRPQPYLLLPDPGAPGRLDALRGALRDVTCAIGPSVPLEQAALSLRLARQALSLMRRGSIGGDGHFHCDDHLPTLLLAGNEGLLRLMNERLLADLAHLTPGQFERLAETLLVWISTGCSVPEVAARLSMHPQSVRYRMRRLEQLFGDRLHDPEWRFEMELILRGRSLFPGEPGEEGAVPTA